MALTSDGMESETGHGGLADVHGQLMDWGTMWTAQCQQSARDGWQRLVEGEPPITSEKEKKEKERKNTCLVTKKKQRG